MDKFISQRQETPKYYTRLDVLQLKCLFSFGELRFFCFLALLYSQVYLGSASNSTRFYKNIGFYTERVALDLRKLRGQILISVLSGDDRYLTFRRNELVSDFEGTDLLNNDYHTIDVHGNRDDGLTCSSRYGGEFRFYQCIFQIEIDCTIGLEVLAVATQNRFSSKVFDGK